MSASLVGSEMCIRDSASTSEAQGSRRIGRRVLLLPARECRWGLPRWRPRRQARTTRRGRET
eukprot:12568438-Alexandrium_andersonii.AAC.1